MSLRILLADDDRDSCELVREIFALNGVLVHCVGTSREAVSLASQQKFDGIIAALHPPNLDAFELVRQLRRSSWNRRTPVVVLGSQRDTSTRMQAFQAGATFFLQKPLDKVRLTRLFLGTRGAMFEERRRSKRIPLATEVICGIGPRKFVGNSANLSRDGMLFQGDGSVRRGSTVRLSFRLEVDKPAIHTKAVVVRVDGSHRVGVRFIPVHPLQSEDQLRLREFVARRVDGS